MSFAESISSKTRDQTPHLLDFPFVMASLLSAGIELFLDLGNGGSLLFVQSSAQHIRSTWQKTGKRFADLKDVFFIHDQTKRIFQNRLQRRVGICDWLQSL